ncbi:hypothetical protein [Tenacibaculum dicentrarchi]|uniref:hypothetical protein n=1 Tax=Tenacibaculum dicentrarchi TaxID=669041 RepID=UPI003516FB6E
MIKKSKITVKHYLNTNLKPIKENGKNTYPVYVQIIYNSTNFKFKSENSFFKYLSKGDLQQKIFTTFLNSELERIKKTVNLLSENDEKLLTSKNINRLSKPLHIIIENNFKKLIEKEIKDAPKLITGLSYTEFWDLLFFFNCFQDFENKNEIVKDVMNCIDYISYPNPQQYNTDYIVADLYFGDNYLKLYNEIFSSNLDEKETKKLIKSFRYLSEL